jgi:hypothetical protein
MFPVILFGVAVVFIVMTERKTHTEEEPSVSTRDHLRGAVDSIARDMTRGPVGTSVLGLGVGAVLLARGGVEAGKRVGETAINAGLGTAKIIFSRNRR